MLEFDEVIDRRGTHCSKWDMMESHYGVPSDTGLAMWVADMDFRPPPSVNEVLLAAAAHGVHGYFGDDRAYKSAITGWMATRHGWEVDPEAIATTHGVVAGLALCLQTFTGPGDGVILFTPVYHAFYRVIRANGRAVVELPLVLRDDGRYAMDLEALAARLDGRERMVVLCSPHNPGGRIWSCEELRALADFCVAHDLILVSDEIHHDLVLTSERHLPMPLAAPEITDRLVMLTATTKTFNIAGALTGNVIIADPDLRRRFAATHLAAGSGPNRFGLLMATAAYAGGAAWLDALRGYLAGNAAVFGRASPPSPACGRCRSTRPISPGSTSRARACRPRSSSPESSATPASPRATGGPSEPAATPSCASTSLPRAAGLKRPSAGCGRRSPTLGRFRRVTAQ